MLFVSRNVFTINLNTDDNQNSKKITQTFELYNGGAWKM